MRKSLLLPLIASLVLTSCGITAEQGLPAEEVLRLTAEKSSTLLSASFEAKTDFKVHNMAFPASGAATIKGTLQDGGNAMQFNAVVDTLVSPEGANETFHILGDADVVMMGKGETYLHLNALSTQPEQNLFKKDLLELMTGKWWLLPSGGNGTNIPGGVLTPSPSFLKLQSQVVRVTSDEGFTTVDGRKAYHYRVGLDTEKLLQFLEQVSRDRKETFDRNAVMPLLSKIKANGELWVDAETFLLRRVSWEIEGIQEQGGGMIVDGSFSVTLTDHNSAPPILSPKDAKVLTPNLLMGGAQSSSSVLLPGS